MNINWNHLTEPFDAEDVEWRVGSVTRDKKKGMALPYLTSRAVCQRLDDVFGPGGWKNEYRAGPDGGVVCRIYFRNEEGEWVWREDGADNTDVEAVKGGLSSAMKRAGAALGIGRYLYALPAQWIALDERGRFAAPPKLPAAYTRRGAPARDQPGPRVVKPRPGAAGRVDAAARDRATAPVPAAPADADVEPGSAPEYVERVAAAFRALSWSRGAVTAALAASFGVEDVADLRPEDVEPAVELAGDAGERDAYVRRARSTTRTVGAPSPGLTSADGTRIG